MLECIEAVRVDRGADALGHDRQGFGDWDARPMRPIGGQRIEYIRRRDCATGSSPSAPHAFSSPSIHPDQACPDNADFVGINTNLTHRPKVAQQVCGSRFEMAGGRAKTPGDRISPCR
jgi:hypothetical protein